MGGGGISGAPGEGKLSIDLGVTAKHRGAGRERRLDFVSLFRLFFLLFLFFSSWVLLSRREMSWITPAAFLFLFSSLFLCIIFSFSLFLCFIFSLVSPRIKLHLLSSSDGAQSRRGGDGSPVRLREELSLIRHKLCWLPAAPRCGAFFPFFLSRFCLSFFF